MFQLFPRPSRLLSLFPILTVLLLGLSQAPLRASDDPLGVVVDAEAGRTTFRLHAPRATGVEVALHESASGGEGVRHAMTFAESGIWSLTVDENLTGRYYAFHLTGPEGPGNFFDPTVEISDPYARANVGHDGRSLIVDGAFSWTDEGFKAPPAQDLVVYEMHVKDFSFHESAGVSDPAMRGKYRALTLDRGDGKLLSHLKALGVNAVELMPIHEYDHTAAPPGNINHWGYMTSHFFAPESSFASGMDQGQAVAELKEAINALHAAGIAVILDVVYNHTHEGNEDGPTTSLKGIDAPYYYRMPDDRAFFFNGTGCGNEFRSESEYGRRLILDSVRYWVEEFHVDGFRFDLGAGIDMETMRAVQQAVPEAILVCEPWTADWSRRQWDKGQMWDGRWGLWNDGFRDTIHGFIEGLTTRNEVMTAVSGSCFWGAQNPTGSVNYVEAHDGYTMADRVKGDAAKHRLAAVALLTAQGIPMLHQGQEFMKSKNGDHNSYNQDSAINWIDWSVKEQNQEIFAFFQGLIEIRKQLKAFRYGRCLQQEDIEWIRPDNPRTVGFLLQGPEGDPDVLVLLNGDKTHWTNFDLPRPGAWSILCNGTAAAVDGSLGSAEGSYHLPPTTGVILRAP